MRAIATGEGSRFSSGVPWLGQKWLSYLPAKEVPKLSSSWLEERTISGFLLGLRQHLLQLTHHLRRKHACFELLHDLGVFSVDLLFGLVLLVVPVHQPVHRHEKIHPVGANEVRFRHHQAAADFIVGNFVEDARCQQHAGGFAADLAVADLALVDFVQVGHGKPLLGDLDVGELIADHAPDEQHFDLAQAVLQGLALGGRLLFDGKSLLEEHALRG